jgi:hypothetical protein
MYASPARGGAVEGGIDKDAHHFVARVSPTVVATKAQTRNETVV